MTLETTCAAAEALERNLGDPQNPESILSFRRAVELDDAEEFPTDACRFLDEAGFYEIYVPAAQGGRWKDTDEITLLMRLVARRDLTVAIAHGKTFLGSIAVWMDGSPSQKQELAAIVRDRGLVSLALTERAHGSDLAATDVTATIDGERVTLAGEKWLINNATRGRALSVLCRMGDTEPPHPLSMVFVDKRALAEGSFRPLPKNRTHGIRGADISGIAFDNCVLPASAIIGKPGRGFQTVLRLLQVTRIGCCPLSLGAADTALRTTLDFAVTRQLYGKGMSELPYARHMLTSSFVDLLIAEAVAVTAARTLHVAPAQLGVASAIAKYLVPTTVENQIRTLSVALGARFYLRQGHCDGIFEKIVRDSALVGLFDGSTVVNLDALASQLPALVEGRRQPIERDQMRSLFDLSSPLPPFDLSRLSLLAGGRNDVIAALPPIAKEIAAIDGTAGPLDVLGSVNALLGAILDELRLFDDRVRACGDQRSERFKSPRVFELAKRYCAFYAASACAQLWLWNRQTSTGLARHPAWLSVALVRLLDTLRPTHDISVPASALAEVESEMMCLHRERRLLSLLPVQLATEVAAG